jgi:hypothetical protein
VVQGALGRLDDLGAVGQSQIVVGGEVEEIEPPLLELLLQLDARHRTRRHRLPVEVVPPELRVVVPLGVRLEDGEDVVA